MVDILNKQPQTSRPWVLRACARINDGVRYGLHRRTNELRAA